MKSILLLLSLSLLLAKACEEPDTFVVGESFELAMGQEVLNKGANLQIKWTELSEDSRCPKNTNCVWEGQARMQLLVNDQIVELIIRSGMPEKAQTLVADGYILEAQSLLPYPEGTKIDPATYRLRLLVTAI
jgi:hypothetical protein